MESHTAPPLEPPSPSTPPLGVPWTSGDIGRAILVVLFAIPVLVGIGVAAIRAFALRDQGLAVGLAISILLQAVLVCAAWWFSVRKYQVPWSTLGYRWNPSSQHLKTSVAGILMALGIVVSYSLVLHALHLEDRVPKQPLFDQDNPVFLAVATLLAVMIAPVVEETFFRGFIFTGLLRGLRPWGAALMSAGFFALAHISPWTYAPIFGIGLVLCWVYLKTGSVLYSMLVHLSYNALTVFASLATR